MNSNPTPRRIEWAGPEGWTVWTDEDGTHIRTARGESMEMPDVERLFSLWQHVRATTSADHIPAPKPLTREEARADGYRRTEEYAARRAVKAIEREFNDTDTAAPF
ncbi:MAG TPA: hypothetical protein VF049_00075 [Nocardioidaceae bacterium]